MEPSVIEQLRLTKFKSFSDAVLPLDSFTILVGRNGSGKSNALDGLWALARLAEGEEIRDALDGGRDEPPVRGGVAGCAPLGEFDFEIGCRVRTGTRSVDFDVVIQTEPEVRVLWERLRQGERDLLFADFPQDDSSDISAIWANNKRGPNPSLRFRSNRLLISQVLSRIPPTAAGQKVHMAAGQVLAALRAVFVLDPVPHQMRQYVPRRDTLLRRDARNLSAAVSPLLARSDSRDRIMSALARLNEQNIIDVSLSASQLDDVMLTLTERFQGRDHKIPARLMSDGTLRFLAMLVAMMQSPTVETMREPAPSEDALGQRTVVIEEVENGLHASQASMLVSFIRQEVKRRSVRALVTAHSPALLDALTGEEHRSVVICQRDSEGQSTLTRLVDLPNYWRIAAKGGLGKAAEEDRLRAADDSVPDAAGMLDRILGGQTS